MEVIGDQLFPVLPSDRAQEPPVPEEDQLRGIYRRRGWPEWRIEDILTQRKKGKRR